MKKRGKGIASIFYPTGMSGGGDPSNALIKMKLDGTIDLLVGSIDIGQGCKTVLAQLAAEELGLAMEQVTVINDNTDSCPMDTGTFASRVTHSMGNAVVMAARELRQEILELAASDLKTSPVNLTIENGEVKIKQSPDKKIALADLAGKATFGMGKILAGRGGYVKAPTAKDEETGACNPFATAAYATTVAEVEVDTETGQVEVLQLISVYDVGKAINPMLCEGQIDGGSVMGLGMALMENLNPYYPGIDFQPTSFADYMIPVSQDTGKITAKIIEKPSTTSLYGTKGIGEMTANSEAPAIVNAVYNAIGVRITDLPITPEKIIRGLEKKV
ncbi:MAG: xanthine dehydrogenase family protein molybdopterin-binding subunit [Deltaproteobacteria bacterium]|nr:xanthine dehydrogenase family protein molybdopterin-binding subunit [Deltaproteobacteria bacterium]